jgi:hypothetical protein
MPSCVCGSAIRNIPGLIPWTSPPRTSAAARACGARTRPVIRAPRGSCPVNGLGRHAASQMIATHPTFEFQRAVRTCDLLQAHWQVCGRSSMRRAGPPRRIRTVSGPITGRLLLAGIVQWYSRRHRGTAPNTLHNVHIPFPEQTEGRHTCQQKNKL